MAQLEVFNNGGIELVVDRETGAAFATQAGYARMSGITKQAVSKRIKGVNQNKLKMAEILTPGGLQGVNLIPADLVFEWLMRDNIELALAMGKAGATVYIHQLAGYTINSTIAPRTRLEIIMDLPDPWQAFYDKNFCDRVQPFLIPLNVYAIV